MIIRFADGTSVDATSQRFTELVPYAREMFAQVTGGDLHQVRFTDAGEAGAFMIGQLTYLENQVFEVQNIPLQYAKLIPVDSSIGAHANSYMYEICDYSGVARDISNSADDLPEVDVAYGQVTMNISGLGIKYSYTMQELRESTFLRRPISDAKALAASNAEQKFINNVALIGSASKNFTGLLNNPNVPVAATTLSGTQIGSGTATQAIADICQGLFKVWSNSAYNDLANVVGVPPSMLNYLTQAFPGTTALESIEAWIKKNNISKSQGQIDITFVGIPQLENLGSGGSRRMIFYVKDRNRVRYIYPMQLKFLAPQFRNLKVSFPGENRYSGTAVYYPQSMYYIDNA